MKLSILTGTLVLGSLMVAGSGLAAVEATGMVGAFAHESIDSTLDFTSDLAAEVQAKGHLAADAAQAIAQNGVSTAGAVAGMEAGALAGAPESFPTECLLYPDTSTAALLAKQSCLFAWTNTFLEA